VRVISFFLSLLLSSVLCVAQSGSEPSSDSAKEGPNSPSPGQLPAQAQPDSSPLPDSPAAQKAQTSAQVSADKTKSDPRDKRREETSGTSDDRLFWTLPNFLSVSGKDVPPLTTGQKFKVVARGTFDPVEYFYIAFLSGISQAQDSEPGFGQGAAGYGKRYGAAFADNAIENFMTGAVLPSLLKQDPRYYELGKGGFPHRAGYAIGRICLTRSDSAHTQFNLSEVVGSALSAGISNYTYHPRADRSLRNALSVWGTQVGWDTLTFGVKEFWPDVRRKWNRKKQKVGSIAAPPAKGDPAKTPNR